MPAASTQDSLKAYEARPWVANYAKGVNWELTEFPIKTLSELVTRSCEKYSDKIAYTTCLDNGLDGSITYSEVDTLSRHFAQFLVGELGLQKGDRVAVQLPNCLAYPIVAFGTMRAGCVLVNTNPLYTEPEMEHQFKDSGAKVIVILDMFADKLTQVIPKTGVHTVVKVSIADLFPFLKKTLVQTVLKIKKKIPESKVHSLSLMTALASGASKNSTQLHDVTADDIAALQYTGGTTGVSKGAMLTHANLMGNMHQLLAMVKLHLISGQETILTALPLYHIFAFTVNNLAFFAIGARNILIPSPRPISNLRKAFEKYDITWMTGVNTLYNALANEEWFAKNPPRSLKISLAGGASLQQAVADKWVKVTGTPVYEGYGLTESSPVLSFNPIGGKLKKESIGVPLPATEIRCVDDNGAPVPLGQPGELIAKGPQVMLGYWNRPDETEKTLKNGWLYTGDVAVMDEDGYVKIVDRKKDMVLVNGFNVYPNEVESVIMLHPGVMEVAVIGIPDDSSGEAVKAYVILKNPDVSAENIREFCRSHLVAYKVPRTVEFRKELPKTPVGKILRKDLRAELLNSKK